MAHLSECEAPLSVTTSIVSNLKDLPTQRVKPAVTLLWLPARRTDLDAAGCLAAFDVIRDWARVLHDESVICILTSPPDAARLLARLDRVLRFQLWVAVKTPVHASGNNVLPSRHCALLVLSKYNSTLRHAKTRVAYTFCPACNRTTKDYGGKKHTYHEYGTLLSDVWRDIDCDPAHDIKPVTERLADFFGLSPYADLQLLDLRKCKQLKPLPTPPHREEIDCLEQLHGSRPSVRLVNADCLTALKSIPDESVDYCFADPPYNIEKKYDRWDDALEVEQYFAWCDQWLSELARILRPGRTLSVINIPLWAVRHYRFLCERMRFQMWIGWEGLSLPVRLVMPSHYSIICFSKGSPRPLPGLVSPPLGEEDSLLPPKEFFCVRQACIARRMKDREDITDLWHDIHRLKHNSKRVDHPCQLPPMLMRRLLAVFTRTGELIVDPFNGAGTSSLVAEQMGRAAIGIELSLDYHDLAARRHEALRAGSDPFGKSDGTPNAKNSRVARLVKQQYHVPKKVLQLDVRRIAQELGHLPTRAEVEALSKYPIEYFEDYFISWGEVCAAARTTGMSELPVDFRDPQLTLQF